MPMPGFSLTKRVSGSPEEVFSIYADLGNAAERISGITRVEILDEGPVGVGTRFRETRVMMGREATEEMEVTAFEPPSSYTVECLSHGTHYVSVFTFEDAGEGETDVTVRFDAFPRSFLAKLLSPLGALMMGTVRKCTQGDLDDLAAYAAEQRRAAAEPA